MQTFLPYPDFVSSLRCLDYRRLGKQRVEAMQLVRAIESGGAWSNHPAAKMWKDHVPALKLYHDTAILVWTRRGYKNTMQPYGVGYAPVPDWFGDEKFHASHRSNLLRKAPEHYGQFGWTESPNLEYVWPV